MIYNPDNLTVTENHRLMIGSIVPRPIALISTISKDGILNLAPFSFFTGISTVPPTICFAPARRGLAAEKKDTLINIEDTGEFVVNVVNEAITLAMNDTAGEYPPEIDEFSECGLTPAPSLVIRPPRVAESPINLECRLLQIVEIGKGGPGSGYLVIGEIVMYHVQDEFLRDGRIDVPKLKPVGRLAGLDYTTLGTVFSLERKKV